MFRIFLRKKLLSGKTDARAAGDTHPARVSRQRNRRLFQRYNVTQHHLTMMNDQDILVIRDLSAKGFSSDVSERAFERFLIDDVYEARMRYLGETYDLEIRVTWKELKTVGFELVDPSAETLGFMRRLLHPIEIANSLKQVDAEFMRDNKESKVWFHGEFETELFLWKTDIGELIAWKLISGADFVEWKNSAGMITGSIARPLPGSRLEFESLSAPEEIESRDRVIDPHRKQFATDLIMALSSQLRDEIMATIAR